jgi:methyltransferase (TIGR00027 family)
MAAEEPLIRSVADTARWVAVYRARETKRPGALFQDRFARRLAGERGERIAKAMGGGSGATWFFTVRTTLMDRMLMEEIAAGADMVINLAAGLDCRPYRMQLPPGLIWVDVDTGELIDEKEAVLVNEKPNCRVERYRRDLAQPEARNELFAELGARAKRAVVLSEGFVMYLKPDHVRALAQDLAAQPSIRAWILDLYRPRMLRRNSRSRMGRMLRDANVEFQFAPAEGVKFFEPAGWRCAEIKSTLREAARIGSFMFRAFRFLFERGPEEQYALSAICRFVR